MSLLDANTLTLIKADQALALPQTAVIKRPTVTNDGMGGVTESLSTVATVDCRVAPSNGRELAVAAKLSDVGTFTLTFPAGTDVTAKDRVVVSSRTFHVETLAVGDVDLAWETVVRALCTEVKT